MHVAVDSARRNDMSFRGPDIRVHAHREPWRYAIHKIGVASLADSYDPAILNADVGLDDARNGVDDQSVG